MEKGKSPTGQSVQLKDRISNLPFGILVRIISLLPLKEAAATSIISKPWRYLWASTMTLNFEAVNFDEADTLCRFLCLEEDLRDRESRSYVNWVNHVVKQYRNQSIERFRACFFLESGFASDIDRWIQFAMVKRVQILELEFFTDSLVFTEDNYTFPHKLILDLEKRSSSSKRLFSDIPSLRPCGFNIGFKSLKVLRFQHVGVTGEVVQFFLSNCPVLERLSLTTAKDLVNLRVVGPSVALKYLEIKYCHQLRKIEVCDANIVSFIYCGRLIDLQFKNVPMLVEVSIYKLGIYNEFIRHVFGQLSCCLSRIEILKLDIRGAVHDENLVFPKLENLKHLELLVDADYYWSLGRVASFMKAAPYLQRLVLGLGFGSRPNEDIAKLEKAAKCPHHYIKVIEIAGYRGHKCCVKHVMYLKKNAVALEKIVINPVRFWCCPTGIESNVLGVNEEVNARDHAIQYLKPKVPSTIKFVCL